MNTLEAYVAIKDRSLLGLFSEHDAMSLLNSATVEALEAGQALEKNRIVPSLILVVQGRVALRGGEHRDRQGFVNVGRAVELRSILSGTDSKFDWFADTATTIMRIPLSDLNAVLARDPELEIYLKLVTINSELQNFKNDLRLFGFSAAEIRRFYCALQTSSVQAFQSESIRGERSVVVVKSGSLELLAETDGEFVPVSSFHSGSYLSTTPDFSGLKAQPTSDCAVWTLTESAVVSIVGKVKAESFFSMIDLRTPEEFPSTSQQKSEPQPDEEIDDNLTVADFSVDEKELRRIHRRRKISVRQQDEMDCGAACLSTIAQFYGRKLTVPTFRSIVHITREGASMLALKKAAAVVGFEAIGVMSGTKGLKKLRPPFIALMQYHFVVVYRVTDTSVTLSDPGRGLVTMTIDDFKKEYSQNVLLIRTTPRFFQYPESAFTYRKYLLLLQGVKASVFEVLIASFIIFAFALATPLFMQLLFDNVLANRNTAILNVIAFSMISLCVISIALEWVRGYTLTQITSKLDAKFAALFMRHTMNLPLSFFAVRRVGDITTRLSEIEKIRDFFTSRSVAMMINILSVVIYSIVIGLYSWKLLGIVAVLLPLMILCLAFMIPYLTQNLQNAYRAIAKNQSLTYEQFSGLETLKTLGGLVAARWRWENTLNESLRLRKKFEQMNAALSGVAEFFKESTSIFLLLGAVYLYLRNELTLGQVVALNTLAGSLVRPAISIIGEWNSFNQVAVSLARVDDILTSAVETDSSREQFRTKKLAGAIEFRDTCFRYGSELSPLILNRVSLKIEPGQTIAFVGRSGSGKTTLAYMVNRLYAPTDGAVVLDGVDSAEIPLNTIRRQVAMIMQENSLFSGTVLENITVGDPQPSFDRAMKAAQAADAHEFISKLTSGYSTILGEAGGGLSGGQKQRLNIARALYLNPKVLIMDEATSALDAVSEEKVVRNIRARGRGLTTLIIAHRLNTILHADRIVVLDRGQIIEQGTHKELLMRRGTYFQMFRKQMSA